jgi:hypothetical protein
MGLTVLLRPTTCAVTFREQRVLILLRRRVPTLQDGHAVYEELGLPWATSLLVSLSTALFSVSILFYTFGERIRKWSRDKPEFGPPPGRGGRALRKRG